MTGAIKQKERELGRLTAVWNALRGKDLSHYPRFLDENGVERQISDDEIIDRMIGELRKLKDHGNSEIEFALKRGRESLDEVKGLTEYEDQKATRNLTIITFISALAGVLFSGFSEDYPIRSMVDVLAANGIVEIAQISLIVATYGLFFAFVTCAIMGALVVFHATRIRFKYPAITMLDLGENVGRAGSFLFYSPIIQVLPERWAQSFLQKELEGADESMLVDPSLGVSYLKNYVIESYLVATKVAEKLRYLMPAQSILSSSIKILLVWLVFVISTIIMVPSYGEIDTTEATISRSTTEGQGTGAFSESGDAIQGQQD